MINIISRSIYQLHHSGPRKVVDNTIKGLELLGIPYSINRNPLDCKFNWIHDDKRAISYLFKNISNIKSDSKFVFGPNIYYKPEEIVKEFGNLNDSPLVKGSYLMPSEWVINFWINHGYTLPIVNWPAGIDTDLFKPIESDTAEKNKVLLYTKNRSNTDIEEIINFLNDNNIEFINFGYGKYREAKLSDAINQCKFAIIIVSSESQGIAIEEIMSMNIPLIVFDIEYLNQHSYLDSRYFAGNTINREPATSVPYFDNSCGIKSQSIADIKKSILDFKNTIDLKAKYKPRDYILSNLNLKKQAEALITALSYKIESNINTETPKNSPKTWINSTWLRPLIIAKSLFRYLKQDFF